MGRAILVLVATLGAAAGLGALLGAATTTARPPLFLLAGLLAFCAAYLLGLLLAARRIAASRRRARAVLFCAGTVVIAGLFAWTALPESALGHAGHRVEKNCVFVVPLARAAVRLHLVEVRLREAPVPLLGFEDFVLSHVPGYRKFAGAEEYVTGILSLPKV